MNSNNHSSSQGKPRGKVTIILVVIIALAVLGLLLSQMDGRVVIVMSGAATATRTAASITVIPSLTDIAPTSVENISPSATAEPIMQGERLEICESDICIVSSDGKSIPLGLKTDYQIYPGFGFSPDGSKVVFNACLKTELQENPAYQFCHELFIADRNGNVSRLTNTYNFPESHPSWSPDGNWIAIGGWSLSLIRLDGIGLTTLISDTAVGNAHASAWSPNSEQIAFISGNYDFNINWGFQNAVFIINRDGSGWRKIFELPEPRPIQEDWITEIAWSPDGQSLAIAFHDGRAYSIDVNCEAGKDGCRLSDLNTIPEIPQNWLDTFYPQWNGAQQNTFIPTLIPLAEQARAFAEPILQAIANRPPDYEYDFNETENGWINGVEESNTRGYVDGEYFVTVKPSGGTGAGPGQNFVFSDFVAELDARILKATDPGGWGFIFREQPFPQSFRYHINFNSSGLSLFLDTGSYTDLFYMQGAPVQPAPGTNHLLVIAKGSNIAIYVNGEPVTVVNDTTLSSGIVSLGIHAGEQETEVRFDNFKIWDISDLP